MTRHYPDLGSASNWLKQISHAARTIRSTTQIWVVTRHQCGISALVSQMSLVGETSGSVAKCRLFSQATIHRQPLHILLFDDANIDTLSSLDFNSFEVRVISFRLILNYIYFLLFSLSTLILLTCMYLILCK